MMKSYILYDENNNVKQFIRCHENEIELYESLYIEVEFEDFHFDSNFTYKIVNNEIVKSERVDSSYLSSKRKLLIQELISKIEVEYNGIEYQGNEESQNRISRAINSLSGIDTIQWKAKDNNLYELNKDDLIEILSLITKEQTKIYTSII